ncbi:MAG: MFS transporter, partial [Methylocella sp.]
VTLMVVILLFSAFAFASGLAPSLTIFLILRLAFGVAMGGEWGVGAALAMETIPARARGLVSGILQTGYASGFLLAAITYLAMNKIVLDEHFRWRLMFMAGALPALLLVWYIRRKVEESPAFLARTGRHAASVRAFLAHIVRLLRANAGRFFYAVLLMTAFNAVAHGTQDLYPTFLQVQRLFPPLTVGLIVIVYFAGAIPGGLLFGALSQRIGRRWAIVIAAILVLPVIRFWAYGTDPVILAAGAFFMGFFVQGAWGVVPVHLNELSPAALRATFPGFAYQLGNVLASGTATIQAYIAKANGGNYAFALATVAAIAAVMLAVLAIFGPEAHGVDFEAG